MRLIIHADGGSRGNPGLAAIGATLKDERGKLVAAISQRIGRTTNNQAEYQALIAALKKALELGVTEVGIYLDSELVVKQVTGSYRVKNEALKPLYSEVKRLLGQLQAFKITHVPRAQNKEADKLANDAFN